MKRTTEPGQTAQHNERQERLEEIIVGVPHKSPAEVQHFLSHPPMIKMPNPVTVPSPFFVHSDRLGDPGFHQPPVRLQYGKTIAELQGAKLTTADEDVFLALAKIARMHERLVFATTVNNIVRAMGTTVATDTRAKVLKSLKRMQLAAVTLKLPDGDEYNVTMLPEYYYRDRDGTVLINMDTYFQQMFVNKMVTRLDTRFRATLKGDVAKRLYAFFQRSWRPGKPYQVGLRKLCRSINLDIVGKPPWRYRQQIIAGLQELHSKGYLKMWALLEKRLVQVVFSPAKHTELTEETLEEASQAQARKRHEKQMEKKKAALREKEQGVPEGVCPHGRRFGEYSHYFEQCRLCGRERACDDIAYEREEQLRAQQQQQRAATAGGTIRPFFPKENVINVEDLLDSQPDEECEENGPNLNM